MCPFQNSTVTCCKLVCSWCLLCVWWNARMTLCRIHLLKYGPILGYMLIQWCNSSRYFSFIWWISYHSFVYLSVDYVPISKFYCNLLQIGLLLVPVMCLMKCMNDIVLKTFAQVWAYFGIYVGLWSYFRCPLSIMCYFPPAAYCSDCSMFFWNGDVKFGHVHCWNNG